MGRAPGCEGLRPASRAGVLVVSVLAPACLACQRADGCGPPARARGLSLPAPPAVPGCAAPADGEGDPWAADGACMHTDLLQRGALLSQGLLEGPLAHGAAGRRNASGGTARSGAAALPTSLPTMIGLGAELLAEEWQGRRGAAGGGSEILLVFIVPVLLIVPICVTCGWCFSSPRHLHEGPAGFGQQAADSASGKQLAWLPGDKPRFPKGSVQDALASSLPPTHASLGATYPGYAATVGAYAAPAASDTPPAAAPILCQTLVLPNLESCFHISAESLRSRRPGILEIKGTSKRTLLEAYVQDQQLDISSLGNDTRPRVTIRWEGRVLMVHGRGDSPFGSLEPQTGPNDYALIRGGEARMKVLAEPGQGLQLRAFAVDGRQLASAGCVGPEWRLTVKANADAILIAACMLAMTFLSTRAPVSQTPRSGRAAGTPQPSMSSSALRPARSPHAASPSPAPSFAGATPSATAPSARFVRPRQRTPPPAAGG